MVLWYQPESEVTQSGVLLTGLFLKHLKLTHHISVNTVKQGLRMGHAASLSDLLNG